MDLKKYLMSLTWNSFEKYPPQGSCIYVHAYTTDRSELHKFVRVNQFNAVSFNAAKIVSKSAHKGGWCFEWLPAAQIDIEGGDANRYSGDAE